MKLKAERQEQIAHLESLRESAAIGALGALEVSLSEEVAHASSVHAPAGRRETQRI